MLNFEWHMLKSLCEISFLEFQIVVNISLEKVKEECAFNYPRLSFNLIYYRTLRSLSSSVFLSFFFRDEFRISVWMLCLHSTQPDEIFRRVALRNKMSVKNHLFFRFCCPVVTLCSKCPIFVQKFKFIKIFEFLRVKLVLFQC